MTHSTDLDIWNPCSSIALSITVTEGTVQIDFLFVNEMVEQNGLIDGLPGEDWENGKECLFCLVLKPMEGDGGKKKNQGNKNEQGKERFHIYFIILDRISVCQEKSPRVN